MNGKEKMVLMVSTYDEYIKFYAQYLREKINMKKSGYNVNSLIFHDLTGIFEIIPGPALVTYNDKVHSVTEGLKAFQINTPCEKNQLPEIILEALELSERMQKVLGGPLSPLENRTCNNILQGRLLKELICRIGSLKLSNYCETKNLFTYRVVPFGVTFKVYPFSFKELSGDLRIQILKVFDPYQGFKNLPNETTLIELLEEEGPLQALLEIHAALENSFAYDYYKNGSPRIH